MNIGQRIREEREAQGMKQGELATKAGIAQATLSELESGKNTSSVFLASIADVLGVNPRWLETGRGTKHANKGFSNTELALIAAHRAATDEGRLFIEMAASQAPKRPVEE
jgi:transcriptional regulator with XRE-family HTH domain